MDLGGEDRHVGGRIAICVGSRGERPREVLGTGGEHTDRAVLCAGACTCASVSGDVKGGGYALPGPCV